MSKVQKSSNFNAENAAGEADKVRLEEEAAHKKDVANKALAEHNENATNGATPNHTPETHGKSKRSNK